jgi:hypothetical protein
VSDEWIVNTDDWDEVPPEGPPARVQHRDKQQKRVEATRALDLKKQGKSLRQIAEIMSEEFGYPVNHMLVARRIDQELDRASKLRGSGLAIQRQLMQEELDDMRRVAREIMYGEYYATAGGKVILDPETGEVLRDPVPKLQALDRLIKIQDREAKLFGLDAPTRQNLNVTHQTVDPRLTELIDQARQRIKAERVEDQAAIAQFSETLLDDGVVDAEFSDEDGPEQL